MSETRLAAPADAEVVAALLDDFNREFDTETPGTAVLAARLGSLLADASTFAVLGGDPVVGVALVTLRPNVWYPGPVALLDEMYVVPGRRGSGIGSAVIERMLRECVARGVSAVEINVDEGDVDAQRFYERHGFRGTDESGERAFFYEREL